MKLRWKVSLTATSLHTALCCVGGLRLVETSLAQILQGSVDDLRRALDAASLDGPSTLETLLGLSADYENKRQLTQVALTRLRGATAVVESTVNEIAAAIGSLERGVLQAHPDLVEELALRARPLQEQWNARGPGLMHEMARLTDSLMVPEAAEVVLVDPCVGGHGWAHLRLNRVTMEALLANPYEELPEAVRLAWLLGQLNCDLPRFAEVVPGTRLPLLAQLAVLPAALTAGEQVGWSTCTAGTVRKALECWHCDIESPSELSERLFRWWETFRAGSTRWDVAWRALAELISSE